MRLSVSILASVLLALVFLGPSPSSRASDKAPLSSAADDEDTSVTFGLEDPVIIKADWESALLRTGDLNGDGLPDLLTINNQKSVLQVFYQKKGESRPFEKKEIVLDDPLDSMAVGDFNGDKRDDLVLAPKDKDLLIRYQQPDGTLGPAVPVEAQGAAVQAADVDGDGVTDIVALGMEKLFILYGSAKDLPENTKPVMFFNGATPGSYPMIGDLDGNGLNDVLYLDRARRSRMLVRFQSTPRVWDLETAFEITETGDLAIVKPGGKQAAARLATTHPSTRELRLYRLDSAAPVAEKMPLQAPHFLSIDPKIQAEGESLLAADIDGNGRQDIVIASPKAAEITLFLQTDQGKLAMRSAPSLSGITSLAAIPRKSGALLFALSAEREETISVSAWDPARGLSVPVFLNSPQKPLVMATGDLDGSGKLDLLYVVKDEKAGVKLLAFLNPTDTNVFAQNPVARPLPLGADEEPSALMAADLNGDKRCDLLVFSNYSPLRVLMQKADGTFAPLASDQSVAKGIFNKITPGQVSLADLDGNGATELLIAGESFVRAYGVDKAGNLRPAEQFNGKNASAHMESAVAVDLDGSGRPEVVLLDSVNKCLTIYARDSATGKAGAYTLVRNHELQGTNATRLLAADANGDGRQDLVVYGGDSTQLFYAGQTSAKFKPVWTHEPAEKDAQYARVATAPLLKGEFGGADQLLALEGTEHLLEFYLLDKNSLDQAPRFFHFKVFDDEASMGRGRDVSPSAEPRSLAAADIDRDGRPDLLALVHDNILYYRQFEVRRK